MAVPDVKNPKEVLREALDERLVDEEGNPIAITLRPGLSEAEVDALEKAVGAPLPAEIRELLTYASGFEYAPMDFVDFEGYLAFEFAEALPRGRPICGDGYGNFWVVDVTSDGTWGGVFFACHDPPVLVYQAPSLAAFLDDLFDMRRPNPRGHVDSVLDEGVTTIWRKDPWVRPVSDVDASGDPELATFCKRLKPQHLVCDLRKRTRGQGFAWGRFGPKTPVVRDGDRLLFAIEKPEPRSLWDRVLGRT
jgi:hypothetical protein